METIEWGGEAIAIRKWYPPFVLVRFHRQFEWNFGVEMQALSLLWVQMCIFLFIFQFCVFCLVSERVDDFEIYLSCSHHQLLLLPLILFYFISLRCRCYQFKLFLTVIAISSSVSLSLAARFILRSVDVCRIHLNFVSGHYLDELK